MHHRGLRPRKKKEKESFYGGGGVFFFLPSGWGGYLDQKKEVFAQAWRILMGAFTLGGAGLRGMKVRLCQRTPWGVGKRGGRKTSRRAPLPKSGKSKWGLSKWGLKVLVQNCPRLLTIVVIL